MATEKELALTPRLTDEFLATLEEAVRVCGSGVDFVESNQFAAWCFRLAGKEYPDEEPYESL
jgi:hypothetical protein